MSAPASKSRARPAQNPDAQRHASARTQLGFWSLVVTQFQGAFNDNALKFLVIYIIVDLNLPPSRRDWLVLVIGGLFAFPFILFSMTGGYLADRFSKRTVTIGTKWMEAGVMTFALLALGRGSIALESAGVFLLSTQAALFGPSKYGLLPEILPEKDLSWGNGVIELGTFLAAIGATVAAGYLAFYFRGKQHWSGMVLLGCTLFGLATSFGITRVGAANPERKFHFNPLGDLFEQVRAVRADRILEWAIVGNTYLWFLAALLQFTIVIYGHDILRIDDRHISYLQAAVAVGIGLGSLATGYLSDAKIEYGLIPLGALGMSIFGFLSAGHSPTLASAATYLGMLGFFGGFYAVPLNALIQHRPEPERKGGVIAAANLLSFVGVFGAAGAYFVLSEGLHLGADKIFLAGACMSVGAALYAVVLLPDSVVRLGLWALSHTLYRVRVEGRDNIPERDAALFTASKLSAGEAVLIAAATDRPVHFILRGSGDQAARSIIERMLRIGYCGAATNLQRRDALRESMTSALRAGEVVCLEEDTLHLLAGGEAGNKGWLPTIPQNARVPVIGVAVEAAAASFRRSEDGRLHWRAPARVPAHVVVRFGEPRLLSTPLPAVARIAEEL